THVHTTLYSIRSSCTYILSRHCFLFHAVVFFFFFFNHPAPTEIYTLSLHDALPISSNRSNGWCAWTSPRSPPRRRARRIAMPYGWTGQLLRIDLTKGSTTKEPLNLEWAREYIGGRGLGTRYLYEEMNPTVDALSPDNKLIFAT